MIDDSEGKEAHSIISRGLLEIEGVSWITVVTRATHWKHTHPWAILGQNDSLPDR
jgi:hypothetical protein